MANKNSSTENLDHSLNIAYDHLNVWAKSIENTSLLAQAFGNRFDRDISKTLIQNWQEKNFTEFPNLEIVSASKINNAKGAYAKSDRTIYLAQELLNQANNESIAAIILEEYGHHLDTLLNQVDTPGDEGAIFSALVRGKELAPEQLQTIKIEDDNAVVHLNGQPVRIEQAASFPSSRSGAGDSVTVVLDAGATKGTIELGFETYYVPDRIQLFYEGGTLYDSGFIGTQGTKTVSKDFDGDSSLITVQMTPNVPNPQGTLWEFTANAEVVECPETGDLSLKPENGEFEPGNTEGVCEASGQINVGRSDPGATSELIGVTGMNPRHDDEKFQVEEGLVYALINPNLENIPLFKTDGSLDLAFSDSTGSFTEDSSNDFTLAGLEVDFEKIRLDRDKIVLEGGFSLPNAIGDLDFNLNAPNALIISSNAVEVDGGNLNFPDEEFKLFDAFNVTSESASIEYLPVDDELKIQGKLALVTPFFKSESNSDGATIALDLAGQNYIKIVNGQADFSGEFSIGNVSLTDRWKLNKLALALTTEDEAITDASGTADIVLPLSFGPGKPDGTGIAVQFGLTFPDSGAELDNIRMEINDLDILVGSTGFVLQSLEGDVIALAPSNNDDIEFVGKLGLTYGPQIDVELDESFLIGGNFSGSAVDLKIVGSANKTALGGSVIATMISKDIFQVIGGVDLNWDNNNKFFSANGFFTALENIFTGNSQVKFDFTKDKFEGSGISKIAFPDTDFFNNALRDIPLGGKEVVSAQFSFSYSDDNVDSNDFIRAFGQVDLGFGNFGLGYQFNFDNNHKILTDRPELLVPVNNANQSSVVALSLASSSFALENDSLADFYPTNLTQNNSTNAFKETYRVESNLDFILLNVLWDNVSAQVDPNQVQVQIIDPNGNTIDESDFDRHPDIKVSEQLTGGRSKAVAVDNPASGDWGIRILDETGIENIRTSIYRPVEQIDPTLEILDVIQNEDGSEVTITYKAVDPDTETTFDLYYQKENSGYDFLKSKTIVSDLSENDGTGTFVWNTEGVAPGEYYIYGQIKGQHGIRTYNSNYSVDPINIARQADLSVSLSAASDKIVVGEEIIYTATIENNSDNFESKDIQLSFAVPEGASLVSATHPITPSENVPEADSNTKIFKIDSLAPGENYEIDIKLEAPDTANLSGASTGVYLISNTYDPNTNNDFSDINVDVVEPPVLKPFLVLDRIDRNSSGEVIEPDPSRIEIQRDEPYTYEIAVTNTGEGTATGVVLTENIFDLAPQLGEVTLTQGDYFYDSETGEITANFGEIAAGETETVSITLTPGKAKKASSTSTIEYNEWNVTNEITTQTKIKLPPIEPADLELSQTVDNPIPSLGEEVNITLNLFNQGPGVAGQVEIRNSLPEGLAFVRANAGFGSYDSATGIWSAGNIANGAGTSLIITARVEDIGNFTNQAEVISTGQADPDSTPNNGDPDEDDFSSLTIKNADIDTDEDISVTILASELLSSYAGNNPQITEITVSTDGTAIINADGNVEFAPNPNFNGIASFEYTIVDGENISTASTKVLVRPINDPLIANDDIFTTDEDVSPTILASELFINDVNNDIEKELNISSVDNAVNGTASLNGEGDIQFFLDANFNGTASFDYTVTDGDDSETASVEVIVNAVNDAPVANDDIFTIDEDTPLTLLATELLSNDTDVETPENLSVIGVENAVDGTVSLGEEGDIEFFPDGNFNGTASFNYTVTDGTDDTTGLVEIEVNPVNDTPFITTPPSRSQSAQKLSQQYYRLCQLL